uniref:hypothetical protein n=1 Tax=Candidatus Ventrenecus sp. TaxID=3085654 RepID=UPI004028F7CA
MKLKYFTIIILTFFLSLGIVNAKEVMPLNEINPIGQNEAVLLAEETTTSSNSENPNYCTGLRSTFVFIGHLIRLAKILIPIIVIIFGTLDFFKAVTGAKDDEIKKAAKSLLFRALAGVCIFFLPAVIDFIFSLVDGWSNSEYESGYQDCFKCVWDVGSCTK